jgi:uncharacterized protein (TIGR02996 family)
MPRYAKPTAKGVDFIDVRLRDKTIQTSAGRLGAKVKATSTKHGSERMAESKFRLAMKAAKAKGFEHVSKSHVTVENPTIERAIFEHPEDDAPRVVYGDWLQERGDPRGELIAVQQQLRGASGSSATSLRRRENALLAEHSSIWYGTLDEILYERTYSQRAPLRMEWRLGFFDEIEVRHSEDGTTHSPWSKEPTRKVSEILQALRELHSARFVTRVILGGFAANYAPAIRVLATGWPETLRSFTITGQLGGESTPNTYRIGSLVAFCKAHPQLEQLTLYLRTELPGAIELPRLQQLALLNNNGLSKRQLRDVIGGAWPAVRSFEFDVNALTLAPADLQPLFKAKLFPALETLRIGWMRDPDHARAVATLLRKSSLFEQLRELVITGPQWGTFQATVAPMVAEVLTGTHLTVSVSDRET